MKSFTILDLRTVLPEKEATALISIASKAFPNADYVSKYVPSSTRWGPCQRHTNVLNFDTKLVITRLQHLVTKENKNPNHNHKRNMYITALNKLMKGTKNDSA